MSTEKIEILNEALLLLSLENMAVGVPAAEGCLMRIHESIGRFNKSVFQLRFDDVLAEAGMTREDVESGATLQELAMRLQRERTRVARLERLLGTRGTR